MTPEAFAAHIHRLGRAGIKAEIRSSLVVVGLRAERVAKDGYLSGTRLRVRSGRLRSSVAARVETASDAVAELHLRAGGGTGNVRYARIHEYGGTILPIRGKGLAIPVGRSLTAAGVSRGEGGEFRLVRSVTLPARHYMRDTLRLAADALVPVLGERLAAAMRGA